MLGEYLISTSLDFFLGVSCQGFEGAMWVNYTSGLQMGCRNVTVGTEDESSLGISPVLLSNTASV